MKILIICGHGAGDPGACSSYGVEATETRKVGDRLAQLLKPYMEVVMYPQGRNAYADVQNGTFAASLIGIDYVFEIHFNSASANARGTEVWVTPMEGSTAVEQKIVNNLANIGFVNRGVKSEYFAVITHCKNRGVSSALVETCFISNQSDMNIYRSKFEQICQAMARGIVEGFGMQYKGAATTTKSTKKDYKGDNVMFNEGFYLDKYKDVAKAVKAGAFTSGYDHYIKYGKNEKRLPVPPMPLNFKEADYLELNPDVAKAVKAGGFVSGAHHYLTYGYKENRKVCKSENDTIKEKDNTIKNLKSKIDKAQSALK